MSGITCGCIFGGRLSLLSVGRIAGHDQLRRSLIGQDERHTDSGFLIFLVRIEIPQKCRRIKRHINISGLRDGFYRCVCRSSDNGLCGRIPDRISHRFIRFRIRLLHGVRSCYRPALLRRISLICRLRCLLFRLIRILLRIGISHDLIEQIQTDKLGTVYRTDPGKAHRSHPCHG